MKIYENWLKQCSNCPHNDRIFTFLDIAVYVRCEYDKNEDIFHPEDRPKECQNRK